MKRTLLYAVSIVLTYISTYGAEVRSITSPSGDITLSFNLLLGGIPSYTVDYLGKNVIPESQLGLSVKNPQDGFDTGFTIKDVKTSSYAGTWSPVWGENDTIIDKYNSMTISLFNPKAKTKLDIEFRVYDDGIGFRYVLPKQGRKNLVITDELSQFAMPGDITAWWIPGDYDTQEYEYTKSRLSEIRKHNTKTQTDNVSQQGFSSTGVQTSMMLKTDDGVYLNLHEAALIDYYCCPIKLDGGKNVWLDC